MSYFNEDQEDSMRYLDSLSPEMKCWCGWYEAGKCDTPSPCPADATMADRLKATCACGGYPGKPGSPMYHRPGCLARYEKLERENLGDPDLKTGIYAPQPAGN
jgi:hypothetical protein